MTLTEFLLSYKCSELVVASQDVTLEHKFSEFIEDCKQPGEAPLLQRQLLAKDIIHDAFLIANALIDNETSTNKKVWLATSRLSVISTVLIALSATRREDIDNVFMSTVLITLNASRREDDNVSEQVSDNPWAPLSDYSDERV